MANSVRNVGTGVVIADDHQNNPQSANNLVKAEQPDVFRPSATGFQERFVVDGGSVRKLALNKQQSNQTKTAAPRMDPASERQLAKLDPQLSERIRLAAADLKSQGIKIVVAPKGGLRTFAEQNELYAQGRTEPGRIVTKVRAGGSYHNYGLAVDVVPTTRDGKPTWDASEETWNKIGKAGEKQGLDWGGDWTGFKDRPHFELDGDTDSATELLPIYNKGQLPAVWKFINHQYPSIGGTVPTATNQTAPTAKLQRGDEGEQVEQLQTALVKLKYMTQADMNTGPGTFGAHTDEALRAFQREHKDVNGRQLTDDGVYGALTRGALAKALGSTNRTGVIAPPANPIVDQAKKIVRT